MYFSGEFFAGIGGALGVIVLPYLILWLPRGIHLTSYDKSRGAFPVRSYRIAHFVLFFALGVLSIVGNRFANNYYLTGFIATLLVALLFYWFRYISLNSPVYSRQPLLFRHNSLDSPVYSKQPQISPDAGSPNLGELANLINKHVNIFKNDYFINEKYKFNLPLVVSYLIALMKYLYKGEILLMNYEVNLFYSAYIRSQTGRAATGSEIEHIQFMVSEYLGEFVGVIHSKGTTKISPLARCFDFLAEKKNPNVVASALPRVAHLGNEFLCNLAFHIGCGGDKETYDFFMRIGEHFSQRGE